jgi:Ca2+-binding EF-hand superfamily protein
MYGISKVTEGGVEKKG